MSPRSIRLTIVAIVALAALAMPARASAEWQIKPFLGVKFGGSTTFFDPEQAAGGVGVIQNEPGPDVKKLILGVNGTLLGEIFGVEADLGHVPGYFQNDASQFHGLVLKSSVTTFTGNLVVAVPRHVVRYSLRPYFVTGFGTMHVVKEDALSLFDGDTLAAFDIGGGATGFMTNHVGVSWDVRYFRSVGGGESVSGLSFGPEQLSFWRATMAAAFRF